MGGASALALLSGTSAAFAQKKYSDGASDTEIKLGHTCPYSGPASAYGQIGKTIEAYWKSVNETQGGVNGPRRRGKQNQRSLDGGGGSGGGSLIASTTPFVAQRCCSFRSLQALTRQTLLLMSCLVLDRGF